MRLSCKFRFHIGILNQHWLVEQGRRLMTDSPATVAPEWAIARNHDATVEEDAVREAPVVPTGGQAGRWQTITDTTTIESSLNDLKEKGATSQDRRFLYVDCIKRTTAALGVGVEIIELDHHLLLNHLVTSFVTQVERAASVGSRAGIVVGNPDVVRLPTSSRSTGRRQVGSYQRFSEAGSRAHAQTGDGRMTRCFIVELRFLFLKQQQYIVLVTPSLWWHMWGTVLAVEREGGGLLCANNKPSTSRYSPLGKQAHPTDRPTGTIKQLFFFGGLFFFFTCAFRATAIDPAEQQQK